MKMCTEVLNTSYSKITCTIDYQNNYEHMGELSSGFSVLNVHMD